MKLVKKNQKFHNPDSPLLIGDVKDDDVVKELVNIDKLTHNKNYYNFLIVILNFVLSSFCGTEQCEFVF